MIIDTNVWLFRWPFRRLPLDETSTLLARLDELGIEQAWAGSFDGLLHRDVGGVNRRLNHECNTVGRDRLLPFGCVNPSLPDWKEDVRRCAEDYGMRGIRLHPNYHGYTLQDGCAEELFALAAESELILQLAVRMEDDRTQHPLVQVPDVELEPLPALLDAHPQLNVVLLNGLRSVRAASLKELSRRRNVYFETAMLEGVGGIDTGIKQVPYDRLLFGSYAPFFDPESSRLKLDESQPGATIRAAIESGNARRLLGERKARARVQAD